MYILRLLLLFTITISAHAEFKLGACIQDPNASALQKEWKHYLDLKKKRAGINTKLLVKNIRMDMDTLKLLQAISEVETLMNIFDELENKYLYKAFVDTRFNEMISHPDFLARLARKEIDNEIKTSELKFKNDPYFYELLDKVRAEISRPEINEAIDLFRTYDLGILEKNYRQSAKGALKLIRAKGASVEAVRGWLHDPPFLKNIPLPKAQLGPFAIRYRSLLTKSISQFVTDREISFVEAKKYFPKIKQTEVDEMNSLMPPTEKNSFDESIATLGDTEQTAIDGVARTLWGEAASCETQGLYQFEAIAKIIADRSLSVERAINEQAELEKKSEIVREQNWTTVLKNWVGIKRPAPGLQNKPVRRLKGLSDFGRKEKINYNPAAQVISKKGQFSVWNSFSLKSFHTKKLHKNIPDVVYQIQGPQSENDDRALVRILCPEFQTDEQKELWAKAQTLAKDIVTAPQILTKKITWPIASEILFYTHDAQLYFAKEVKVPHLLIENKKFSIKKKGRGACNNFRLFIPKTKNQY